MKPYAKAQTIKYTQAQDRRRKLTDEQRAEILRLRKEEGATYRGLARQFGVSRRLITYICDPEAAQKNREHIASTWKLYRERRGKDENARIAREFKNRKYKMYMNGELTEKPNTKRRRIMNINQLTGIIAVHDDTALNARFSFAVNTNNNKVTYTITCYWKKRNIYGECPFNDYKDAALYFDGLPAVAKMEQ